MWIHFAEFGRTDTWGRFHAVGRADRWLKRKEDDVIHCPTGPNCVFSSRVKAFYR